MHTEHPRRRNVGDNSVPNAEKDRNRSLSRLVGGDSEQMDKMTPVMPAQKPESCFESGSSADDSSLLSDFEVEHKAKVAQSVNVAGSSKRALLTGLSPTVSNAIIRIVATVVMISLFSLAVYMGPLMLVLLVLLIQLTCFHEIINIGYIVYRSHDLPMFRTLSWAFLFASNYYLFGESLIDRFRILLSEKDFLAPLVDHHRFISFCLYCGTIIAFVLSLVRRHYLKQFTLFGWTHVTLLIIVTSSHFIIQNIFNGLIWFLLPVAMVICNDIMAYVCGMLFGRTPLIKLSPKKTWEGFIGGGICSLLFGLLFSWTIIDNKHFICPIEYDDTVGALSLNCMPDLIFTPRQFNVTQWLVFLPFKQFTWYPFFSHCALIGLFVSVVGPFGGFFASGFKRAFKIKDFGDAIPGHGGMMDRFDCQVLIGSFVFLYYNSFLRMPSPSALHRHVSILPPNDQLDFLYVLLEGLIRRGILSDNFVAPFLLHLSEKRRLLREADLNTFESVPSS